MNKIYLKSNNNLNKQKILKKISKIKEKFQEKNKKW